MSTEDRLKQEANAIREYLPDEVKARFDTLLFEIWDCVDDELWWTRDDTPALIDMERLSPINRQLISAIWAANINTQIKADTAAFYGFDGLIQGDDNET